jgi:hypothetical protein
VILKAAPEPSSTRGGDGDLTGKNGNGPWRARLRSNMEKLKWLRMCKHRF